MNPQTTDEALDAVARAAVLAGELAGAVTLVWRKGRVEHAAALGLCDLHTRLPAKRDTLFRVASMTKPITAVAALMLIEEGRVELNAPITRFAPELTNMRVLPPEAASNAQATRAHRPITFGDLLTHRSGLSYGDFHGGPLADAYATLGGQIDNELTPERWIARLAEVPLVDQPGNGFHYGLSFDLLGFLIARIEDAPLGDVLRTRIFEPLGMADTGFTVPPAQRHRRAGLCGFTDDGQLAALDSAPGDHARAERPDDMTFVSGGQGLWSTVDDYQAFATTLIGDGFSRGVRLLTSHTRKLLATDQLTPSQRQSAAMFGRPLFSPGNSFGMGVSVVTNPQEANPMHGRGGAGTIAWPGAYGGWWQADPTTDTVLVFLTHSMATLPQLARGIGLNVWSAIAGFHTAATRLASWRA